jgi:hypothetical protein
MKSQYPCLTDEGLLFQLSCGGELLRFRISPEALKLLAARYGYAMDPINLYLAHEALIHLTARVVALEGKPNHPILLDVRRFLAEPAVQRAASSSLSALAA